MDLRDVMAQRRFAVVGDTLNEEKTAYQIKHELADHDYTVYPVGKELQSLNDIPGDIDVIDLCVNPAKGLKLMEECEKDVKAVVLQPGAGDDRLRSYLEENNVPYLDACVLMGLRVYTGN